MYIDEVAPKIDPPSESVWTQCDSTYCQKAFPGTSNHCNNRTDIFSPNGTVFVDISDSFHTSIESRSQLDWCSKASDRRGRFDCLVGSERGGTTSASRSDSENPK